MRDASSARPGQAIQHDSDPAETAEWRDALQALVQAEGSERAGYVLDNLLGHAASLGLRANSQTRTAYLNTIPADEEPPFPGNLAVEERIARINRWNALAMVVRANQAHGELGGHIASYASAADLFEVGFNHFFRARTQDGPGDLVYMQPHSAPGVYARAYLEGFLSEADLAHFRQEITASANGLRGLSSYPHPWLMPDFWQFPTGSMGIGPINAIYQARFMRYLEHRSLMPGADRKVWGIFGDGEMDEPESIAALTLAAREKLDNLVFVVNCNLQRLDGPVRGNGRIIDELETLYAGAGWNVIKLVWGSDWDALLRRDTGGALARAFANTVDGQFQTFAANDGAFNRAHFFNQNPELAALVADWSDEAIDRLHRGGHDMVKIHAAYHRAVRHQGQPTVILAQTKKGFGMGSAGQGKMTTHQQKKLDDVALLAFRDRFALPISDADCLALKFYRPAEDSAELRHLQARRAALGGHIPRRNIEAPRLAPPQAEHWARFALAADGKEMSSTMAIVRMLTALLKDATVGPRIVPIVADEARTFGMANLFRQIGIYSAQGQLYEPEDIGSVLYYREARDGQILEEGITEAGAISSWTAAGTSYSVNGLPMLPFYIYYSMFGFQRIGDLIWAAADQRTRGFLIGATSGRTTLGGEGLQHQDGSSHIMAAAVPNCRAYDPAYAFEVAVIVEHGMRRMLDEQRDEFFYLTVTNENLAQPDMPPGEAVREGILRGMYLLRPARGQAQVRLLGAGPMLREAEMAAQRLQADYGVDAEVWSVTSFSELARAGREAERARVLGLDASDDWVRHCLGGSDAPVVAASDYIRAVPEQIRAWVPAPYRTLGTDGFGRSDTRAQLRDFFEVSADWIVLHALDSLGREEDAKAQRVRLNAGARQTPPWEL
ncbi:alpha-ketoglutarate dehydrogenase [Achromobacter insolitus]|uniref:alpha-ketoglutarate dehydrogenase n=1 Tax=Achromobacter insolitus TaxID=217204 RepID=UPI000CEB4235|nr:alpha-ketoglutarate dehydrogenase [Achromobacter insolitus]AVG37976.1 pyruvate dehydrogenase (acetyl-transferring), homodimeric type [Achromobacter insolitus]AXA74782.1 pyruvate dehydrogenase (acetyl-transferring), homodimeric type [Achromobacter insolitus]MDH3066044.1 alpha-ketoglutarate dehydrogenase [Achromobacter insolitus]QEK96061.1 alpha-ketoglutarate dehydrogenase [Achromobacter insolitus]